MSDSSKPATQDQRRHERYEVTDVIEVLDVLAERTLGRLVDISEGGMLLSSDAPIPLNRIFQVTLSLPRAIPSTEPICVGIESLWHRESPGGCVHWTGFQLISVSELDRLRLERMLGDLRQDAED